MKPPKALLIDLDDTLICYDGYSNESWTEACKAHVGMGLQNAKVQPLVEEILTGASWYFSDPERHRIGRNNLEETRRLIVQEALKKLGVPDNELADKIGDEYSLIRDKRLHLFPGTRETLEALQRRGIPMCMVTNGQTHLQRRKIERFLLEPYFAGILVEGELGFGKPDERVFRKALKILETPAEDAWIIGDNYEWEVVAPKRLGLTAVWVDKRKTGPPADATVRPDAAIYVFSELLDLIASAGV
jgi:putative hydrolase of the HAD superfamily